MLGLVPSVSVDLARPCSGARVKERRSDTGRPDYGH